LTGVNGFGLLAADAWYMGWFGRGGSISPSVMTIGVAAGLGGPTFRWQPAHSVQLYA
jgi:hypothetical protein